MLSFKIIGTSADREIQRTLMELLNQMDGFDVLGKVYSKSSISVQLQSHIIIIIIIIIKAKLKLRPISINLL